MACNGAPAIAPLALPPAVTNLGFARISDSGEAPPPLLPGSPPRQRRSPPCETIVPARLALLLPVHHTTDRMSDPVSSTVAREPMATGEQPPTTLDPLLSELCATVEAKLQPHRRVDLPGDCNQIGLPDAPDDENLTKRQYIQSRLAKLAPDDVRTVAASYVRCYPLGNYGNDGTYGLEELLWEPREPNVTKRVRRELADALDGVELFTEPTAFLDLLASLFVLGPDGFSFSERDTLQWQIQQHVIRNPEDWSVAELFQRLGALDCSSERFRRLIEALAGPDARSNEASQRSFVSAANSSLAARGFELVETDEADGYPSFSFVRLGDPSQGRPQNIIFASTVKPDLRFRDAVDNEIEVVTHANKVLVYDEPISEGLRWCDLQSWWARQKGIDDPDYAKRTLYRRLLASLPVSSPPQRLLFRTFFQHFREQVPTLPALIPEVWLHYDPRTIAQRGRDALLRQRMDFLLLLPAATRIVLEVDGQQHYAEHGRPAPQRYAEMAKTDRELKLCGYDVYHFGAAELCGEAGKQAVCRFLDDLFRKHSIL